MAIVKIDPQFAALIPKLSPEELALLEESIGEEGLREPILQWGDFILDGHNRYKICQKHYWPMAFMQVSLPDRDAALLWIEKNQLGRRNLTDDQRAIVAGRYAKRLAAKRRVTAAEIAGKASGKARSKSNVGNDALPTLKPEQDRSAVEVSKASRVPLRKVRAAQKLEKTPEGRELATKVLNGEMPLAKATKALHRQAPPSDGIPPKTVQRNVRNELHIHTIPLPDCWDAQAQTAWDAINAMMGIGDADVLRMAIVNALNPEEAELVKAGERESTTEAPFERVLGHLDFTLMSLSLTASYRPDEIARCLEVARSFGKRVDAVVSKLEQLIDHQAEVPVQDIAELEVPGRMV